MKKVCILFAVLVMSVMFAVSASAIEVESISLPNEIVMYEGQLLSLNPLIKPENATNKNYVVIGEDYTYTYKSGLLGMTTKIDSCKFSDYISISTNNLLKAKKTTIEPETDIPFFFNITVKATDGSDKTATTKVKIIPKMIDIEYNGLEDNPWYYGNSAKLTVTLDESISFDYTNSQICFKSSDNSIATVSNNGLVNCEGVGCVTITAYTDDNKYSATYELWVRSVVVIEKNCFELCEPGQLYQINAKVVPEHSNDTLRYYSLNPDIATVGANGLVTFHKPGNAAIAVTSSSDPYNDERVWLTSGSCSIQKGSDFEILEKMKMLANNAKDLTYMPDIIIREKRNLENLNASTTAGYAVDISSFAFALDNLFYPTTMCLFAGKTTEQDIINSLPLKGKLHVIDPTLTENDIKKIYIKDSGEYYYEMTMVLKDEIHTALPINPNTTIHGKLFDIITQSIYDEFNRENGLDFSYDSLSIKYYDCSLTLKINKITGNLENATYNLNADIAVSAFRIASLIIPAVNISTTYKDILIVDFSGYIANPCEKDHNYGVWTVANTVTCMSSGIKTRTCVDCGLRENKVIEKLQHSEIVMPEKTPTCTENGNTVGKKCGACGFIIEEPTVVPAVGHNEQIVKGYPATCDKYGLSDGVYCSVCNVIIKNPVEIYPLGHNFSTDFTIDLDPTCTSEGQKSRHCLNCTEKTDVTVIGKLVHTYSSVITAPTCTAQGYTTYTCSCGDTYVGDYVDKLNHSYNIISTITPNCTEKGYNVYACSCGDSYNETIEATGHSFSGSACVNCGFDKADSCTCNCHKSGISGFIWKILSFFYKLFRTNGTCSCGAAHW